MRSERLVEPRAQDVEPAGCGVPEIAGFAELLEGAPIGLAVLDADLRFVEVNETLARIDGIPRAGHLGRTLREVLPRRADRIEPALRRVLESGQTVVDRQMGNGTADRLWQASYYPIGDWGVGVVLVDVTDRVQADHALAVERNLLRSMIDHADEPVFAKDAEGRYIVVNRVVLDHAGLDEEDMLGRTAAEIFAGEIGERFSDQDRRVIRGGEPIVEEDEFTAADGVTRHLVTSITPLREPGGGPPIGLVGISHDVTDRVRLEEELRRSQKLEAVGRLAGGVAHDFNNLLTGIIGGCELLASTQLEDCARREVEAINDAATRAAQLTAQLLAFGRRTVLQPRIVSIDHVVREAVTIVQRVVPGNVEIRVELAQDLPLLHVDPAQLQQAIVNLAVNARDAMPDGGTLTIATGPAGDEVALQLSDTGVGMDEETLERAFEPFFTTKARGDGAGLGLSTALGIVELSGGTLTVETSPGRGTTVRVLLPVAGAAVVEREAKTDGPAAGALTSDQSAREVTVLLVEDEPVVRELAARILRRDGYAVIPAEGANEAIGVLQTRDGDVDAILTDVVMPGLTGPELVALVRPTYPGLRVVFMSGYAEDSAVRDIDPDDAFLAKPFTPAQLSDAVAAALVRV